MDAGRDIDWQGADIKRREWVRPIRGRDWRMRIVWVARDGMRDPAHYGSPPGGTAWFSFGPVGGTLRTFQRDLDAVTPDVTNHFIRLVIRFAEAL